MENAPVVASRGSAQSKKKGLVVADQALEVLGEDA